MSVAKYQKAQRLGLVHTHQVSDGVLPPVNEVAGS